MEIYFNKISEDQFDIKFRIDNTEIYQPYWFFIEKEQYKDLIDFAVDILNGCSRNGNNDIDNYISDNISHLSIE